MKSTTEVLIAKYGAWILVLLVVISRLPFLFDGYGVEEDSWGLVVNAHEMHEWGHYVASRFPGHPLQEYLYALIWDAPAWVYNAFSLFCSAIAVYCFHRALQCIQLDHAFQVSLMLCFIPVFYIAGTYTIDFAWSLAFVCASFWSLVSGRLWLSGILLGMAIGCRLTTGVFVLPWSILLWNKLDLRSWFIHCCKIAIPAAIIGILWFVPAYLVYGTSFFDYSDQFPYPPWTKIIWKASVGVFGLVGLAALVIAKLAAFRNWRKQAFQAITHVDPQRMVFVCLLIIALHIISYLRLPQKSGYLVPMLPFVVLLIGLLVNGKMLKLVTAMFVLAPFCFSMNLTDDLRGAQTSSVAMTFSVSGQEVFIDPLSGSIFSERSKRLRKMEYCKNVIQGMDTLSSKSLIIAGWWYNELKTELYTHPANPHVSLGFYEPCSRLDSLKKAGTTIYFLPEQNLYNDQMFGQECTDRLAQPFPIR